MLRALDPYYVKDFLGHKSFSSTEFFINIERAIFDSTCDEFTVRVTEKLEEIKASHVGDPSWNISIDLASPYEVMKSAT